MRKKKKISGFNRRTLSAGLRVSMGETDRGGTSRFSKQDAARKKAWLENTGGENKHKTKHNMIGTWTSERRKKFRAAQIRRGTVRKLTRKTWGNC